MDAQLRQNLLNLLKDIDNQQATMVEEALNVGIENPYSMRNVDGSFAFLPIISAKAQVLNALAVSGQSS